jgi:hypothetical protein
VTPYSLLEIYPRFREYVVPKFLYFADFGKMCPRNLGEFTPDYTTSLPGNQYSDVTSWTEVFIHIHYHKNLNLTHSRDLQYIRMKLL